MGKSKIAIFSANYNAPGQVDAYRRALFDHFSQLGFEVLFVQATDFFSDVTTEPRVQFAEQRVVRLLKSFQPSAVIFINSAGRVTEVSEFLEKSKIPSLTWFWDHPSMHEAELMRSTPLHCFASANLTFCEWFKNQRPYGGQGLVHFIPFPSIPVPGVIENLSVESWKQRLHSVVFMGSLWNPSRISLFLDQTDKRLKETSGSAQPLNRPGLIEELEELMWALNQGLDLSESSRALCILREAIEKESNILIEGNNYFSALDRIRYLKTAAKFGLSLYGDFGTWSRAVESWLPDLRRSYRFQNISDPRELIGICRDSKIGLNIFHRQNQGGGTNFRFNEYAMSGTPIVSNENKECQRVFPEGEAAFYYRSEEELVQRCEFLLNRPGEAVRVATRAHEIALREYGLDHVVEKILEVLHLSAPEEQKTRVPVDYSTGTLMEGLSSSRVESLKLWVYQIRKYSSNYGFLLTFVKVLVFIWRRCLLQENRFFHQFLEWSEGLKKKVDQRRRASLTGPSSRFQGASSS